MEAIMSEMPLALFTTLASVGAGAFLILAFVFATVSLSEEEAKRIDKLTTIPVVIVLIGFVAAFFHLANPLASFGVFSGIGTSPLSNEIAVGVVFVVVMLIYWIMGLAGKLTEGSRKMLAIVVAVVGVIFAIFMGMAYQMSTIASWNTFGSIAQMLGYFLLGGALSAAAVFELAHVEGEVLAKIKSAGLAVVVIGLILAVAGLAMTASAAAGAVNGFMVGTLLVDEAMGLIIGGCVLLVIAAVLGALWFVGKRFAMQATIALVVVIVGVLVARLAFYALAISVGLTWF